jgi:hypothetical protein
VLFGLVARQRQACAGADLAFEAIALTCFVLAGNTLLRPLVNAINRAPIDQGTTEAIYEVRLTTSPEHLDESRELLRDQLGSANYPPQGIEIIEREQGGTVLQSAISTYNHSAYPQEVRNALARWADHISLPARRCPVPPRGRRNCRRRSRSAALVHPRLFPKSSPKIARKSVLAA